MKNENIEDILKKIGTENVPEDIQKIAKETSDNFSKELAHSKHQNQHYLLEFLMKREITKLAAAAGIIIAVLVISMPFTKSSVAWADIVEKFRTVKFLNVSIYMQENINTEIQKIELWFNQKGQARVYSNKQVIFGEGGNITKAFDIESGTSTEAQYLPGIFLKKLSASNEFSLETILDTIFEGKVKDLKPLINTDTGISEDIVVFDIQPQNNEFWARIWALKESKLPVRIKAWDPSDGDSFEAYFEYTKEQGDDFFNPDSFETLMHSHDFMSRLNVIYAFYNDPGGKSISPEDVIKNTGYHMPEVKQVGMTEDGVFWVISNKATNRMSIGLPFYGYTNIEDDLGRTYYSTFMDEDNVNDTCLNFFVPEDYPYDQRKPSRITLICDTPKIGPDRKSERVGTIELTQWDENAKCPDLSEGGYRDSLFFKQFLADTLPYNETERFDRLLTSIPKWSEQPDNMILHAFWIRTAYRQKKYDLVIEIGPAFFDLLIENPDGIPRSIFRQYLAALARNNQIDEAKTQFNRIERIPQFSPKTDNEDYGLYLSSTASYLAKEAGLSIEQINEILSVDIKNDSRFKNFPNY